MSTPLSLFPTPYTPLQITCWDLVARVLSNELLALLNVLLEVREAGLEQLLLDGINLADGQDLLNTVGAELDVGAEELDALVLVERAVDEGGLNDALLTLGGAEDRVGHAGTSIGHGEGGGAGAVLGLDDLVTAKLDALDELGVGAQLGVPALAEEGHDGDARVAADDGDVLVLGVGALDLADEAGGADDVEGGDAEEAAGVVDAAGLEDLGGDGDGRVDGVADDEDVGLGAVLGAGLGQVADDGGVGVEQVVTGHAGLAGHAGGNEDNLGALEGGGKARGSGLIALDGRLGVDVGDIGGNTRGQADIVEGELSDAGVQLEQQGEGLADTTGSAEDGDLGELKKDCESVNDQLESNEWIRRREASQIGLHALARWGEEHKKSALRLAPRKGLRFSPTPRRRGSGCARP
jgi:hypothetical protein